MTKHTGSASTRIPTVPSTKATGLMISSTEKEKNIGQMEHNMKASTNMEKKTDMVNSYGLIALAIAVTS